MRGSAFVDGAPSPVAVELTVHPDRVEARAPDGRTFAVALADASVTPGGFDGSHVFLRPPDASLTLSSDDAALVPALGAVGDERLRGVLAEVSRHRARHARGAALSLWLYRLRWVALAALVGGLLLVAWLALRP